MYSMVILMNEIFLERKEIVLGCLVATFIIMKKHYFLLYKLYQLPYNDIFMVSYKLSQIYEQYPCSILSL